ncbi:MerR family transcriptional regulator [Arthrobacter sp. H20]|uniref:MerR family transcriptional regulator n=1 Tax=Arthrobacter sp. H20 TaxID=1267981 RepID=UPI0004B2C20F|nr:MerR family transcriptional regulator [Arthrobacter sp. H20]
MTTNHRSSTASRTMHIGELADETGLSLRTIRHYDDVGLLPASTRTDGGFRVYTEADLARLLVIRSMKPLGFTLEEMAELLDTIARLDQSAPDPADRVLLEEYISDAQAKREKLARNLRQADEFIHSLQTK